MTNFRFSRALVEIFVPCERRVRLITSRCTPWPDSLVLCKMASHELGGCSAATGHTAVWRSTTSAHPNRCGWRARRFAAASTPTRIALTYNQEYRWRLPRARILLQRGRHWADAPRPLPSLPVTSQPTQSQPRSTTGRPRSARSRRPMRDLVSRSLRTNLLA